MRRSTLATIACLPLVLASCSDDSLASEGSPSPEPTPTAESSEASTEPTSDPDLPSDDDIQGFVETIAGWELSDLEQARDAVVEGSPAADYLTYAIHSENSRIDAGNPNDRDADVNSVEGGFEICEEFEGEETCASYADFIGESGKIQSFSIEGTPVDERLLMGAGTEVEGPAGSSVEFVAAYENASGTHLFVSFELRSGDRALDYPSASYRSTEGRQSQADGTQGSLSLAPESMSHYMASFPGAELGGELLLDLYGPEVQGEETVVVPTAE